MTIYVKCTSGSKLEVVSGHQSLQAALQVDGKAAVEDIETGEQMEVHEVGSELLVISGRVAEQVQSLAATAIARAATVEQKSGGLLIRQRLRMRGSLGMLFAAVLAICMGYAVGLLAASLLGSNTSNLPSVGAGLGLAILFKDEIRKHPWIATGLIAVCAVMFVAVEWVYLTREKPPTPAEEIAKIASEMRKNYSGINDFVPSRLQQNCVVTVSNGDVKVEPTAIAGCDPDKVTK